MQDETQHFEKDTKQPGDVTVNQGSSSPGVTIQTEKSEVTIKPSQKLAPESKIFNVSLRGLLALIVVVTLCAMAMRQIDAKEPFYTVSITIVAFYFGQAQRKTATQ